MMKLTFFYPITIFLFFLTFKSIQAQDTTQVETPKYIYHQINGGFFFMKNNSSDLNKVLGENDFNSISENIFGSTLEFSNHIGRFMIVPGVQFYRSSRTFNNNNSSMKIGGFGMALTFGYSIVKTNNFRFTPYLGSLSTFTNLKMKDHTSVNSFSDFINQSRKEGSLTFTSISLDLGIKAERMFFLKKRRKWDCAQNSNYFSLGIKTGYLIQLDKSKRAQGYFYNYPVNGAPVYGLQGPYIKVFVGIGTKVRLVKWK